MTQAQQEWLDLFEARVSAWRGTAQQFTIWTERILWTEDDVRVQTRGRHIWTWDSHGDTDFIGAPFQGKFLVMWNHYLAPDFQDRIGQYTIN